MVDRTIFLAGITLSLAFFSGMLGSSLPSPLYPIYSDLFNLSASQIMVVFGVYAAGVLMTLITTTRIKVLSKHYSRAVSLGLGCVLLSSVLMVLASDFRMLVAARFITGIGSGILMVYVNRALLKIFSHSGNTAALMASVSLVAGQALGPVITGSVLHSNYHPLITPFLTLSAISLIALLSLRFYASIIDLPATTSGQKTILALLPEGEPGSMLSLKVSCAAIFLSWAMASTFMSQGPTIARSYYGIESSQWVSYSLSAFLTVAGLTQIIMRKVVAHSSLNIGVTAQGFALILLFLSVWNTSFILLGIAVVIEGFAYGAILVGAATITNDFARNTGKVQFINLLYILGYVGNWLPLLLSVMMDKIAVKQALDFYLTFNILFAVAIIYFSRKMGKWKQQV